MRIESIIEAIIFVADSPLKPEQLLEILSDSEIEGFQPGLEAIVEILEQLENKYSSTEEFSFELRRIDGGFQFFTKRAFFPFVRHAVTVTSRKKLSRANLETLAIIAYRQPVTKPEIEYIRGVNCDHSIQKLLEKKLIEIRGREKAPGNPLLYATSPEFMTFFGINDISDLPKLQEFSIDEDEYRKQFETYLKDNDELSSFSEMTSGAEISNEQLEVHLKVEEEHTEENGTNIEEE